MEEKIFLDKIANWMGFDNARQLMRNKNITVKALHSEDIEGFYQRIYLVTEKEDDTYSIYILRMFGFEQHQISISEDYSNNLSFDELIENLGVIIKTVVDKIK